MFSRKGKPPQDSEMISTAILVLGLIVIGIIMIMVIRVQRGLLGIALAGLAAFLLIYWLREVRKMVKKEWLPVPPSKQAGWTYDVIDHGKDLEVVAEVPGPEGDVKVKVEGNVLEIMGGLGFRKHLDFLEDVEIERYSYQNGVLEVRLKKKMNA